MTETTPATQWQTSSGEGEFSATGNPNLDTEAGLDLLTESSVNIVLEDSSYTGVAATTWSENNGS